MYRKRVQSCSFSTVGGNAVFEESLWDSGAGIVWVTLDFLILLELIPLVSVSFPYSWGAWIRMRSPVSMTFSFVNELSNGTVTGHTSFLTVKDGELAWVLNWDFWTSKLLGTEWNGSSKLLSSSGELKSSYSFATKLALLTKWSKQGSTLVAWFFYSSLV